MINEYVFILSLRHSCAASPDPVLSVAKDRQMEAGPIDIHNNDTGGALAQATSSGAMRHLPLQVKASCRHS